jgi:uncharacterized membrane protein YhiD involved in acid resistance
LSGGVLGWERESDHKAAGLRTHILVGLALALFIGIVAMEIETFRTNQTSCAVIRFE